jgi:hypothetical protein
LGKSFKTAAIPDDILTKRGKAKDREEKKQTKETSVAKPQDAEKSKQKAKTVAGNQHGCATSTCSNGTRSSEGELSSSDSDAGRTNWYEIHNNTADNLVFVRHSHRYLAAAPPGH